MIGPPAIVLVLLGSLFSLLAGYPLTHLALDGAAAVAIRLSLSMSTTTARRVPCRLVPLAVLLVTFAAISLLHWPLLWVVLGVGSASVAVEYAHLLRKVPALKGYCRHCSRCSPRYHWSVSGKARPWSPTLSDRMLMCITGLAY